MSKIRYIWKEVQATGLSTDTNEQVWTMSTYKMKISKT